MRVLKIIPETIVDGVGLRMSIYFSGCNHQCQGCHNQTSWDEHLGREFNHEHILEFIDMYKRNPLLAGITLTGGDPYFNPNDLLQALKIIRGELPNVNIWMYTGYTYEQIMKDHIKKECLNYLDVLVEGPFIASRKDPNLLFRGSSNQRIITLKGFIFE